MPGARPDQQDKAWPGYHLQVLEDRPSSVMLAASEQKEWLIKGKGNGRWVFGEESDVVELQRGTEEEREKIRRT